MLAGATFLHHGGKGQGEVNQWGEFQTRPFSFAFNTLLITLSSRLGLNHADIEFGNVRIFIGELDAI